MSLRCTDDVIEIGQLSDYVQAITCANYFSFCKLLQLFPAVLGVLVPSQTGQKGLNVRWSRGCVGALLINHNRFALKKRRDGRTGGRYTVALCFPM